MSVIAFNGEIENYVEKRDQQVEGFLQFTLVFCYCFDQFLEFNYNTVVSSSITFRTKAMNNDDDDVDDDDGNANITGAKAKQIIVGCCINNGKK